MRRFLPALLVAGTTCAQAQDFQVGVFGGVNTLSPGRFSTDESRRYVIGPSVEARLFKRRFGVEVSALYRRFGSSFAFFPSATPPAENQGPPPLSAVYSRFRANSWELPVLGKAYFRDNDARWRPFVGMGYSLRMQWVESTNSLHYVGASAPQRDRISNTTGVLIGGTAVAGFEIQRWNRLSFQPQVRYTRWSDGAGGVGQLNQLDVGIGIRF